MATSDRKGRLDNSALFADAPSQFLAFPQGEAITAPEITAFAINWIRSHDVAFRFASNGVSNQTIETLVNYFRAPSAKGAASKNSICKMMQKAVRDTGLYKFFYNKTVNNQQVTVTSEWTIGRHDSTNLKDRYGTWDATNLELTGKAPCLRKGTQVDNVRFDSLAMGVQRFPSRTLGDGLNLTSCVRYAVANPQEDLMFPRDFTMLTNRLGRRNIDQRHHDEQVFERWANRTLPSPVTRLIPAHLQLPRPQFDATQPVGQPLGVIPAVQPVVAIPVSQPTVPTLQPAASGPTPQPTVTRRASKHQSGTRSGLARVTANRRAPFAAVKPYAGVRKSRSSSNQASKSHADRARAAKVGRGDANILRRIAAVLEPVEPERVAHPTLDPAIGNLITLQTATPILDMGQSLDDLRHQQQFADMSSMSTYQQPYMQDAYMNGMGLGTVYTQNDWSSNEFLDARHNIGALDPILSQPTTNDGGMFSSFPYLQTAPLAPYEGLYSQQIGLNAAMADQGPSDFSYSELSDHGGAGSHGIGTFYPQVHRPPHDSWF